MAGIGIGNMGSGDQGSFLGRREVQYVAVCDVRKEFRDSAKDRADKHYKNNNCAAYNDFREVLARPDIDAVHVATPDHWHALIVIAACRAGKDVYCQKPETRTLREGPLMIAAARRYGRVVVRRQPARVGRLPEDCRSVLGRRAGHGQVDQRQRGPAFAALQLARRTGAAHHGLGHVARPGALGAVQQGPLRRQLLHQRQ